MKISITSYFKWLKSKKGRVGGLLLQRTEIQRDWPVGTLANELSTLLFLGSHKLQKRKTKVNNIGSISTRGCRPSRHCTVIHLHCPVGTLPNNLSALLGTIHSINSSPSRNPIPLITLSGCPIISSIFSQGDPQWFPTISQRQKS
jgi:hypothetical protein